jgi:hypothetical protein
MKDFPLSTVVRAKSLLWAVVLLTTTPAWSQTVAIPSPPVDSGLSTAPTAALDGTIQPSLAPFDPYAPGAVAAPPPSVYTPYAPFSNNPGVAPGATPQEGFVPHAMRLIQDTTIRNTWIYSSGAGYFNLDDVEFATSFAVPFRQQPQPILITPGFNFHFLEGPGAAAGPQGDLPGTLYDAYLGTGWRPQKGRWGADLAISTGVYSDYSSINSQSIRILGRGLGIYNFNERMKFALGVIYFDRLHVKLLPAGGLIWTPNKDARYEITFPNPKLAHRLTNVGNGEIWGYIAGEYGGGMWTVEHTSGLKERVDYEDLRLLLGFEYVGMRNIHGNFEVGYVFNREIEYAVQGYTFDPNDAVLLRAGIRF